MDLALLFAAAFLAATIIPAQSEAVLVGLLMKGEHTAVTLVLVATIGNVLGSCINWWLGRFLEHYKDRPWFPVKPEALNRASRTYQRYGIWTLMFAWVPIIGDPLTVVAGVLRVPFVMFVVFVTIGKAARYIALAAALQ
jgi:membrane protein YqaA with SNARE-associated domain